METDNLSMERAEVNVGNSLKVILFTPTLVYCDLKSLASIFTLNHSTCKKLIKESSDDDNCDFWYAVSKAFCFAHGLYFRESVHVNFGKKSYFLENLTPLRKKWAMDTKESGEDEETIGLHSFKIQVASRFRPGVPLNESLSLPLHQFLKIKRRQLAQQQEKQILVGSAEPEEFLDPLLNSVLVDPVRLLTSDKVVSRSTALQCLRRGGRDPFNDKKMTLNSLQPVPELEKRIEEWKQERMKVDISMGKSDIENYIKDNAVDEDLLNALVEAESLSNAGNRAMQDLRDREMAKRLGSSQQDGMGQKDQASSANNDEEVAAAVPESHLPVEENDENLAEFSSEESNMEKRETADPSNSEDDIGMARWRKTPGQDPPRLVGFQSHPPCVSFYSGSGGGIRNFYLSNVFDGISKQKSVYDGQAYDSVQSVLNGYNACFLVYGQTGSGKTHTMFGPEGILDDEYDGINGIINSLDTGVVPRAMAELIMAKGEFEKMGIFLTLSAQYIEIYNEKISDLLNNNKEVFARRDSGGIVGASEVMVNSLDDAMKMLRIGQARKKFAATAMNDRSSRSHSAVILQVTQKRPDSDSIVTSNLTLVDLAGSERIKKSKVSGLKKAEAIGINSSLLVLGKVITALVEQRRHVPYFESKLTTMLKGAFGGDSKTAIIITCRPNKEHGEESLQSLVFGSSCSMISNHMTRTASSISQVLRTLTDAIEKTRSQLDIMKQKKRENLPAFKKVAESLDHLELRRRNLVFEKCQNGQQEDCF
jgi:kinesin family protein 5